MEDIYTKFIRQNFLPCGIVFSTEKAKKIINRNNLTPSEFLRPFGKFKDIRFHPIEKNPITIISEFQIDFYDSYNYKPINHNEIYNIIDNTLLSQDNIPEWNINDMRTINQKEPILYKLRDFNLPWFNEYSKTLIECAKFNPYDMLQQPLIYIYICSIDDNLEDVIPNRNKGNNIPNLILDGIYFENDIPNLVIILNDKRDEIFSEICKQKNMLLNKFKNGFSRYYQLYWEINGGDETQLNNYEDIWKTYFHKIDIYSKRDNNILSIKHGIYISKEEKKNCKESFEKCFNEYILKLLEKKIKEIDNNINETKKGFTNNFLNFFKKNETFEYTPINRIYKLQPSEKNEYFLAVLYFYFRKYNECYEVSKIFLNDIKPKSQIHYNFGLELNYLSYFIKNYDKDFDVRPPYDYFIKNQLYLHSCRYLFSMMKMLEQKQQFFKAAERLIVANYQIPKYKIINNKILDEKGIPRFSSLIYEQLSLYYLFLPKKMKRKFLFYMFYAGNFYNNESKDYNKYTLNAIGNFYNFIKNINSSFLRIKTAINENMGDLCLSVKYFEGSLRFYQNYLELSKYNKNLEIDKIFEKLKISFKECEKNEKEGNILGGGNNIYNSTYPKIDNTSLLIIYEQDYNISKRNISNFFENPANWKVFEKYSIVPFKKIYVSLTPNDIISLKNLDNIILNKQNFSNFYSKRNFQGNINNKIYVRFNISNPLNKELNITQMKLIAELIEKKSNFNTTTSSNNTKDENEIEIEFQIIKIILPKFKRKENIELYLIPKKEGQIIIKGVEMVLDEMLIIKHYFNKKNLSKLYNYRIKGKRSSSFNRKNSESSNGRKSSGSSLERKNSSSSRSRSRKNSYNIKFSRKTEITFNILDNENDINITFPMGNTINLYKNEFLLMPIKIKNNSNIKIKRFCFFFNDNISYNSNKNNNRAVLTDYIFKEKNLFNEENNNEITIYVPILPTKIGEIYVKILFKFEEERPLEDHEVRRFNIKLNVSESVIFNINENIDKIFSNKIQFSLGTIAYIKNIKKLEDLKIGEKVYFNDDILRNDVNVNEWQNTQNKEYKLLYHKMKFEKKNNEEIEYISRERKQRKISFEINKLFENKIFDFIPNEIKDDFLQSHISKRLCSILLKNNLILTWEAQEINNKKKIFGLYFYKTNLNIPVATSNFLRKILENSCEINHNIKTIQNDKILIHIKLTINKNALNEINTVKSFDIFIDDVNEEFYWIGLKKYSIFVEKNNSNKEQNDFIDLNFNCFTQKKGNFDVNKIAIRIYSNISNKQPLILNKFKSPLIIHS